MELFTAGSIDAHTESVSGFEEAKTEAMEALKMAAKKRESLIVHIESDESEEGKDEPPTTLTSGKKRQHSLESEGDGDSDTLGSKVCVFVYTCVFVCIHCTCVYLCVHMCVCLCTFVCIQASTYTCFLVLQDSGCVSETPQPKRNRVRALDSDVSGLRGVARVWPAVH